MYADSPAEIQAKEEVFAPMREKLKEMFPKAMQVIHEQVPNMDVILKEWYCTYGDPLVAHGWHKLEDHTQVRRTAIGVSNFVYHRRSGTIFNTIYGARHYLVMAGLYILEKIEQGYRTDFTKQGDIFARWFLTGLQSTQALQDQYLFEAIGFYQSSCSSGGYSVHKNMRKNKKENDQMEYLKVSRYDFESDFQLPE